jgi:hypothetical protein
MLSTEKKECWVLTPHVRVVGFCPCERMLALSSVRCWPNAYEQCISEQNTMLDLRVATNACSLLQYDGGSGRLWHWL